MAYSLSVDSQVLYGATSAGTFACIKGVLTFSKRRESTTGEKIKTMCDPVPLVNAGSDDATHELTFLEDLADAQQTALRNARRTGATVYIRTLYNGVAGETQPFVVTSYTTESDVNGTGVNSYVRGSMTLTAAGAATAFP